MAGDNYSRLSLIYNDLVRHVDYHGWAVYILKLIEKFDVRTGRVLELASGTGKLFPKLGFVNGRGIMSDLSFNMLDQASSKYPKVCCDMTRIPFKTGFDLVFSCFDSVNHLSDTDQLAVHFQEVTRVLTPGGWFFFDMVTERNSRAYLSTYSKKRKAGTLSYSQASQYDENSKIHYNKFKITESGKEPVVEENREYIYNDEEMDHILRNSGLEIVAKFDSFTFDPVEDDSYRIQYITRKRNDP